MLSNEDVLIVLGWQINFDTEQKVDVVDYFAASDSYSLLKFKILPVFYTPHFNEFKYTAKVSFFPWPDSPSGPYRHHTHLDTQHSVRFSERVIHRSQGLTV